MRKPLAGFLAALTLTLLLNPSGNAGETRLKRPTVLYGSAQKKGAHQGGTEASGVNDNQGILEGSQSVNNLFPTVKQEQPPPTLMPLQAAKDNNIERPLTGKLSADEVRILASRELIVFVDKSYSMNTRDCPDVIGGIPVNDRSAGFLSLKSGISRWRWVAAHTMDLANQVAPLAPGGFKLILFNDWRQVFEKVTPANIPAIFMSTKVGGSENIVLFLNEELNQYLKRKSESPATTKPLAVAVLTDGLPDDREHMPMLLVNITKQMQNKEDIKIVFIQVGQSNEGGGFLQYLDNQLVPLGARYDIVDQKSFDQVKISGVGRAIVDAISE